MCSTEGIIPPYLLYLGPKPFESERSEKFSPQRSFLSDIWFPANNHDLSLKWAKLFRQRVPQRMENMDRIESCGKIISGFTTKIFLKQNKFKLSHSLITC
jgi:hypothetical protein